jgi:ABC-type antimicrobial peptide transport system permease subunit
VRAVLLRGLALAGAGIAIGSILSLALGRLVGALLYDVDAADPGVLLGVAALLGLVALAASLAPALRASKVDPMVALRDE